jgi:hypothetical protein
MSSPSYHRNYAANSGDAVEVDSMTTREESQATTNGLQPILRGQDPPTSVSLTAETLAVSATTASSTYTSLTTPTIPAGQVVDAKSAMQSYILVPADFESVVDINHENPRASGSVEHNFEPTAANRQSGHDSAILVNNAWNPDPIAATPPPPPRVEPIGYASQPHLSEFSVPHPSYSVGTRGSSGGGSTRYSAETPFVTTSVPSPRTLPPVYLRNNQSTDAATNSDSGNLSGKTNNAPWARLALIFFAAVVVVAVIAVAVLFGVCGTSGCRSESTGDPISKDFESTSNNVVSVAKPTVRPTVAPTLRPTLPPTASPTVSPTDSRKIDLVEYINSITLSGRTIAQPDPTQTLNGMPPEEVALYWIIQRDPMLLTPDSAANQFRIRQRYALKTFWVQLSTDPFFGRNDDECLWNFVTCSIIDLGGEIGEQNVVTRLEVRDAVQGGFLPADLGLLSSLSVVDFTNIGQVGTLPETIGLWTDVSYVSFHTNNFTGSLPTSIGSWTNIQQFFFSNNSLTGSLPLVMSSWRAVEDFWAWGNALSGTIPSFVGEWTKLRDFTVSSNAFSGSIPESIGQLTSLEQMYLDNNQLRGTVPSSVGGWTQLVTLSLAGNSLSGSLPTSIGQWTGLQHLFLDTNQLSGMLPPSVGNWTDLITFSVSDNEFAGSLPESIGRWINLQGFGASNNEFSGTLPSSIGSWADLAMFNVTGNSFSGTLPDVIGQWTAINTFRVDSNIFRGTIPPVIGNWTLLNRADFDGNDFTGTLPSQACASATVFADCLAEVVCECCTLCF